MARAGIEIGLILINLNFFFGTPIIIFPLIINNENCVHQNSTSFDPVIRS